VSKPRLLSFATAWWEFVGSFGGTPAASRTKGRTGYSVPLTTTVHLGISLVHRKTFAVRTISFLVRELTLWLAKASRNLYTGVTSNLERRIVEHRQGLIPGFTVRYRIFRLVHFEEFGDARDAIAREKEIKGWRREKKILMIERGNPSWVDLAEGLPSKGRMDEGEAGVHYRAKAAAESRSLTPVAKGRRPQFGMTACKQPDKESKTNGIWRGRPSGIWHRRRCRVGIRGGGWLFLWAWLGGLGLGRLRLRRRRSGRGGFLRRGCS
jgi:putative endonuclease